LSVVRGGKRQAAAGEQRPCRRCGMPARRLRKGDTTEVDDLARIHVAGTHTANRRQ